MLNKGVLHLKCLVKKKVRGLYIYKGTFTLSNVQAGIEWIFLFDVTLIIVDKIDPANFKGT